MTENQGFKIQAKRKMFFEQIKSFVSIWCKSYSYHTIYVDVSLADEPTYLHFSIRINNTSWEMYIIEKSLFVDFYNIEENDFLLFLVAHNHPTKHLKFIYGLYKLNLNQISTSELEQLVLDNIEDLL